MLAAQESLIARELLEGTGAAVSVTQIDTGLFTGLKIWFADLDEKHGPVAELKPHGLMSHAVTLRLGAFSGSVIRQMASADFEHMQLARALVRSIMQNADVKIVGQSLDDWEVRDGTFKMAAIKRHENIATNSAEAAAATSRDVIVPMMAAMAELIGYDVIQEHGKPEVPEVEGGLSRAIVSRRERNPRNRLLCLRIHGAICKVCGTDPTAVYGPAGSIIEVHHLEPISMLTEPRPYNPETDLAPLCPNCHRAVHTSRPWPLSLEQLSLMMEGADV